MRIGINALYLIPGHVGGTEIHIRNLVKGLSDLDDKNEYFIFINKESQGFFDEIAPRMKVVCSPFRASHRPVRILWEQFILPLQVIYHRLDVLFSTGNTAPFLCPVRSVLTLHDLQHENYPENFSRLQLFFLKTIIRVSAKRAKRILTLSEKVRSDIIKHYKVPEDRISIVYHGVNNEAFYRRERADKEKIKEKYSLPERFVLYLASSLPHKNYMRLLIAFKEVVAEYPDLCLVLIGTREYGSPEIVKKIAELNLEENVIMLGWLPYEDIPLIYSASSLLVFPSLHEGFGLPVIEAMASGVPVVCSDIEPLIEIAGGAAELVDPFSEEAIALGIKKVLQDSELRSILIQKGLKRAQDFTWEKTAMKTLSLLYENTAGHN